MKSLLTETVLFCCFDNKIQSTWVGREASQDCSPAQGKVGLMTITEQANMVG